MTMGPTVPILIAGGGLAGLCCALRLQEAGLPYALYEAGDSVGGRVRTDRVDGFLLDRGFQVLLTAYPEAKRVLDYEALDLKAFYPGALVRHGGGFHLLGDPFRRPCDLLATLRAPMGSLLDKLRVGLLRVEMSRGAPASLLAGEDVPTQKFLTSHGFSKKMIEGFFRPFLGGIFLDASLDTSARMFRYVFRMMASGATAVPRLGMGEIPGQLAAKLAPGTLHLEAPVKRVAPRSITLRNGQQVEGAAVVVATDMTEAANLAHIPERRWNGTTCLYFDAPSPPIQKSILVLNGEGSGRINSLHVVSNLSPDAAPLGRALVSVTVTGDASHPEEDVRAELMGWFGECVRSWNHLRTYTLPHALPSQVPGDLQPPERPVRTEAGIYVCGDHRDQASIQGAMVSGRRAAEAVIADLR